MVTVPESVRAYSERPDIRTAVDLLLSKDTPEVPETLEWGELSSFYRAVLAAHQTQIDFAVLLNDVWSAVWGQPGHAWIARLPRKPGSKALAVSPRNVWDEGCFTRGFDNSSLWLELSVCLEDPSGFQLGLALEREGESLLKDGMLDGWDMDGSDYLWSATGLATLAEEVDLRSLEEQASKALQLINSMNAASSER